MLEGDRSMKHAAERMAKHRNVDPATVAGFGDEWSRFDQSGLSVSERKHLFDAYFSLVPPGVLHRAARVADFGAGSGRWAMEVAPKVGCLICVDASSEALKVARRNLSAARNCKFINSTLDRMAIPDNSLDFAYSLGVLHHVPDTKAAMQSCVRALKPGAPFLVYLYYRFDNRPRWYAGVWRASEWVRALVSRAPHRLRYMLSQILAIGVYWPLARCARLAEHMGWKVENFPLTFYRSRPFYVMRTDALDRFGTRLEQRFTRAEIRAMMEDCGLSNVGFSNSPPFWCAIGWKKVG